MVSNLESSIPSIMSKITCNLKIIAVRELCIKYVIQLLLGQLCRSKISDL